MKSICRKIPFVLGMNVLSALTYVGMVVAIYCTHLPGIFGVVAYVLCFGTSIMLCGLYGYMQDNPDSLLVLWLWVFKG